MKLSFYKVTKLDACIRPLFTNPVTNTPACTEFITCVLQVAGLDPLMDDGVEFAKKLMKLGNQVTLDVVPNLPHGFLCLVRHPDTKEVIQMVLARIKAGLEVPSCNGSNDQPTSDSTEPPDTREYKVTTL